MSAAKPTRPRVAQKPAVSLWLLALGTFAIGTDAFVIAGILPAIEHNLNIGLSAAGQIVTAYAFTYGFGSPFIAALTARFRQEKTILLALVGFAVANVICALSPDYVTLLLARVAAGVCAALYTPAAYTLAALSVGEERRGNALAIVAAGLTASTVLGVPLGVLLATGFSWHATFWFIAFLSAFASIMLAVRPMPAPASRETPPRLTERLAILVRPKTMLVLLPSYLWSTGSLTAYTYIGALLARRGFGSHAIALLLMVYGIGGLAGGRLGGVLADRFGWARPFAVCIALAALDLMLLPWATMSAIGTGALFLVWSCCGWATWAPQQLRLIAYEPGSKSVVLALLNSTIYLATASGAVVGALMLPWIPIFYLPLVGSALSICAIASFAVGEHLVFRRSIFATGS